MASFLTKPPRFTHKKKVWNYIPQRSDRTSGSYSRIAPLGSPALFATQPVLLIMTRSAPMLPPRSDPIPRRAAKPLTCSNHERVFSDPKCTDLATPVHNCHIDQFFLKLRSDPIFSGFAPRVTAIRLTESAINSPETGIFQDLLAVLSTDSTIAVIPLFLISFTSRLLREIIIV